MTTLKRRGFLSALGGLALARVAFAQAKTDAVDMKTLVYSSPEGKDLLLDLYLPQGRSGKAPVIVFLHGGGWSGGTRTTGPDFKRFFAQDGFAMASIDYRLTPSVTFPSNAEDVKTAIRWLKANANTYGLDPQRIGIWGTSAGATLGCVAALSPSGMFEGEGNLDQSSSVACVLDAYGPTFFSLMDEETAEEKNTLQPIAPALASAPGGMGPGGFAGRGGPGRGAPPSAGGPPAGAGGFPGGGGPPGGPGGRGGRGMRGPGGGMPPHDDPNSAESQLIGAPIQSAPDKVKAASPLTYVKNGAPPFLIMHGLADNSVPHQQSILLYEAMAAAGNDVTLRLVDGLPHTFFNRTNLDELAGPFRMDVRTHPADARETYTEDRAGVFDVARQFFAAHLS